MGAGVLGEIGLNGAAEVGPVEVCCRVGEDGGVFIEWSDGRHGWMMGMGLGGGLD